MRRRFSLIALAFLLAIVIFALKIDRFLAINAPVEGNILVVEGWTWRSSSAMREAAAEFRRGHYEWLVTVGQIGDHGAVSIHESSADLVAERLQDLGIPKRFIIALLVPKLSFHNTYASALKVKSWLENSAIETKGVNVFTLGVHARKSLVLFKRALGPDIAVGVIAGTEDTFNPSRWWLSTRGIYVVMRKTVGYIYALVWPLPKGLPVSTDASS